VGSAAHVIGAGSDRPSDRPSPFLGYAIAPLTEALRSDDDKGDVEPIFRQVTSPEQGMINVVYDATTTFPGPEQNLEFVAKRLVRGRS
jgi:hypothetical protein